MAESIDIDGLTPLLRRQSMLAWLLRKQKAWRHALVALQRIVMRDLR